MPRSSNLRERILKVAGEHFLRKGFYKVSVDQLVAELRMSKSSMYKHFNSKEELVATLVDQLNGVIDRQLEQIIEAPQFDFSDKLLQVTRLTSRLQGLIGRQFLEDLRIHTPELWDEFERQRHERIRRHYRRLFQQGVDEGILRGDIDLQLLILAYLQLTELAIDQRQTAGLPYSEEQLYEHLTNLFLEGAMRL